MLETVTTNVAIKLLETQNAIAKRKYQKLVEREEKRQAREQKAADRRLYLDALIAQQKASKSA